MLGTPCASLFDEARACSRKETVMDHQEWVTVYTAADPIKAEIVKNALQAEGIRCNLEGVQADLALTILDVKVQVPTKDVTLARQIIEQHEPSERTTP
jgi:hypothetical protein